MKESFSLESYDYHLPEGLVARYPAEKRDESRLLVLDRRDGTTAHCHFRDLLDYLRPGDCLVMNDSRVFPARLLGHKPTGGRLEIFLLHWPGVSQEAGHDSGGAQADWEPSADSTAEKRAVVQVLYKAAKPLRPGDNYSFGGKHELSVHVLDLTGPGKAMVELRWQGDLQQILEQVGRVPLPPYLGRQDEAMDRERYQTVYARCPGSVAAPTAGLHFSPELMESIRNRGIAMVHLTLHVGYGTFAPIRSSDIRAHRIHSEWISVPVKAADQINQVKASGGRVVAVGTTSVRSLEYAATEDGRVMPCSGECDLYIMPGWRFRVVDGMITNFHLPKSSLLVLVSAFAGRDKTLDAYREAVERQYRFYSYGDAMFIM